MSILSIILLFCSLSFAETSGQDSEWDQYDTMDSKAPGMRIDLNKGGKVRGQSRHGFRMGYGYVNADLQSHDTLRSNWLYLLGYELNQTLYGGSWINVLFVQNISVVGINQSLFIPSGNLLMGFEFNERFQLASGINVVPTDNWCHMVAAAGWTPKVGHINVPFHVSYVPDVDDNWRVYLTTGVNW